MNRGDDMRRFLFWLFGTTLLLATAAPAWAQTATATPSLTVTTPYPTVTAGPGDTVRFDLDLTGPVGTVVDLSVTGVPADWTAKFQGGGNVVDAVTIGPDGAPSVRLQLQIPKEATSGTFSPKLVATAGQTTATLPLTVNVNTVAAGGVELTTDYSALRGPANVTFTYRLRLHNDTPQQLEFALDSSAPPGWQVDVRPSGQSRAATVTVDGGDTTNLTVSVDPPDDTPAGTYEVDVTATAGDQVAQITLGTQITGNFSLRLTTADGRLNATVPHGGSTDLRLSVVNDGTADLSDIKLTATPPSGWAIDFSPTSITQLPAGQTAEVTATITPAGDAIAGDYLATFRAQAKGARDSADVRVTVETSRVGGLIGIGVIVLVVLGVGFVFSRYGRR